MLTFPQCTFVLMSATLGEGLRRVTQTITDPNGDLDWFMEACAELGGDAGRGGRILPLDRTGISRVRGTAAVR